MKHLLLLALPLLGGVSCGGSGPTTDPAERSLTLATELTTSAASPSHAGTMGAQGASAIVAGRTPTTFSVSNMGSATYQIPIWTPPGVGTVKPELALAYDSRSGNGPLGMGWSISGLSTISRCPRSYASLGVTGPVNLAYGDRLCMDGQQLMPTSTGAYGFPGTTYTTELESFSRIQAGPATTGNGPASFTVTTKNGLIYTYGGTADSEIIAGSSGTVRTWALSQIRDRVGNKVSFVYQNDTATGSYRIDHIDYPTTATGQGPFYTVTFGYAARPSDDRPSAYVDGFPVSEPNLLDTIKVSAMGGSSIKSYRLAYEQGPVTHRSRLTTVQECGAAMQSCFVPTVIAYGAGAVAGYSSTPSLVGPPANGFFTGSYPDFPGGCSAHPVDLNGDGRTDLLWGQSFLSADGEACRWYARLATSGGSYTADISLNLESLAGIISPGSLNPSPQAPAMLSGSFLGNGRTQLLFPVRIPQSPSVYSVVDFDPNSNTFSATGVGVSTPTVIGDYGVFNPLTYVYLNPNTPKVFAAADIDGDGKPDVMSIDANGTIYARLNTTPAGGTPSFSMINTVVAATGSILAGIGAQQIADFNADGRADLIVHTQTMMWFYLSNGSARGIANPMTLLKTEPLPLNISGSAPTVVLLDWNGDGCTDYSIGATVNVSDCAGQFVAAVTLPTALAQINTPTAVDVDGDGRDDLVWSLPDYPTNPTSDNVSLVYYHSTGAGVDPAAIPLGIRLAGLATESNPPHLFALDHDGDGLTDLGVYYSDDPSFNAAFLPMVYLHRGLVAGQAPADVATSFTDGYAMTQAFAYAPLTRSSVYTRGRGAVFPEQDIQNATYVVSQLTASSGASPGYGAATYNETFTYEGARRHAQGRGFEGFQKKTVTDSRNGLETADTYLTLFPYTGIVSSHIVRNTATGNLIHKETSDSWMQQRSYPSIGGGSVSGRETVVFPYKKFSWELDYELGGALDGQIITYEGKTLGTYVYGIPTDVLTYRYDLDSTSPTRGQYWSSVVRQVIPDLNAPTWCAGLPSSRTEQKTDPGKPTLTVTTTYDLDPVTCRVQGETVAPSTPLQTKTDYGFDACGNVNRTTVTGTNPDGTPMAPRTTTHDFGVRCQLPETTTNPLSEVERRTYNYSFGAPATVTDANNLVTRYGQDDYGRNARIDHPNGTSSTTTYTNCATDLRCQTTSEYGSDNAIFNNHVRYTDGLERLRIETSVHALAAYFAPTYDVTNNYDALGRVARTDRPYSQAANGYHVYGYDALNRKLTDTLYQPNGTYDRQTSFAYRGRMTTTTDPLQYVVQRRRDVMGRVVEVRVPSVTYLGTGVPPDPQTASALYDYDSHGNLLQTVDEEGKSTLMTYDLLGHKTGMSGEDRGPWTFRSNTLGELVGWTDAKQQTFSAEFDARGRLLSRTEPEGTSVWTYGSDPSTHSVGQLTSVNGYGYSEARVYDAYGQLAHKHITTDQTYTYDYSYNAQGLLETTTYPVSPLPAGATGARVAIQNDYSYGHLFRIQDVTNAPAQPAAPLWTLGSENDYGSPIFEKIGSSVTQTLGQLPQVSIFKSYTPWTNELLTIRANQPLNYSPAGSLQNLVYAWDKRGDLASALCQGSCRLRRVAA